MRHSMIVCAVAIGAVAATGACSSGSDPSARSPVSSSASSSPPGGRSGSPVPTESNPPGDIPDSQVFVAWSPKGGGYTVKVPEGWSRSTHGPATVFTDKFNSIRAEHRASATAPTVASVRSVDLPAIKARSQGFALVKLATVQRKGGRAVLAEYKADSAPNQVTGKAALLDVQRYAFYRPGRGEVVLTLSGVSGADNVDPWRTVTDSFRWT